MLVSTFLVLVLSLPKWTVHRRPYTVDIFIQPL